MPTVDFERNYMLTSAAYKEVLETKVLPWVRKVTKNQITSSNKTVKTIQDCLDGNVSFWSEDFGTVTSFKHFQLRLVGAHWGKSSQDTSQQHRWAPLRLLWTAHGGRCGKASQEGLQELPTLSRECYLRQSWPHWIIWRLWVLIYGYVAKVV